MLNGDARSCALEKCCVPCAEGPRGNLGRCRLLVRVRVWYDLIIRWTFPAFPVQRPLTRQACVATVVESRVVPVSAVAA